jgi:hypothetical protein
MKTIILAVAASGLLLPSLAGAQNQTFDGEIMDSACAQLGSHATMMKSMDIKTTKECTLDCVKAGSKFVLYDPANKRIYQLDDQTKPASFAGEKVRVTGAYDEATKTIHVLSIKRGA